MSFSLRPRRRRTPTVIQMEAVECGAAALASVFAYFGRVVPLEVLREECGVSRDGSNALNLLKVARRHGFIAKGFKYEIAKLRQLKPPAILFWNFNHFVVFEGFASDGKTAWINDPGGGPRKVDPDEFNTAYTGVVLTFERGPEFQRTGRKQSMFPALVRRLRGLEGAIAFLIICGLFLVIPGLVVPAFSRIFIDDFLVGRETGWLRPLIVGMVVTLAVQAGLDFLQQHYLLKLRTKIALTSASHFFRHVLRLPVRYFAQRYAGEIGNRVGLNDQVADLLAGDFIKIVLDLGMIVFFAALMFGYDVLLTSVVIGFSAVNLLVLRAVQRQRTDGSQRILAEHGKLAGTSINGIAMIETLKATGGEDDFFHRWSGLQSAAMRASQEQSRIDVFSSAAPALLGSLSTTAVLAIGGFRIMDGLLTAGSLVAFQALAGNFTGPIQALLNFGSKLQTLQGSMRRLDDVLAHDEDERYLTQKVPIGKPKLSGRLELRNVSFGYSILTPPLIENFDLVIEPGSRVALVGSSGSGKSTVAKLATGLFQPWSGEVLFDSLPVAAIPREAFAASVGVVDQDILLFEGTVHENLTLWDSTIPDEAIVRACRDAEIENVINERPGGLQGEVAEMGANFSGGQRQRLEIARALVHDPGLLVLDEATSALDASTEEAIDANLRRRGCSCLIVAHRLSTIRDADEIIVMNKGRIVQRGQYEQLVAEDGPFASLIDE